MGDRKPRDVKVICIVVAHVAHDLTLWFEKGRKWVYDGLTV